MSRVTPEIRHSLKDHILEEIPAGDQMRVFKMSNGKDWCHLNEFIFTPRGHIVICGDTIISDHSHGIVSCVGYDLSWFAGRLSENYLCEKFFRKDEFDFDDCVKDLKYQVDCYEEGGEIRQKLKELIHELENDWYQDPANYNAVYDAVRLIDTDLLCDLSQGFNYPRQGAAWLCGLQQRFSELIPTIM